MVQVSPILPRPERGNNRMPAELALVAGGEPGSVRIERSFSERPGVLASAKAAGRLNRCTASTSRATASRCDRVQRAVEQRSAAVLEQDARQPAAERVAVASRTGRLRPDHRGAVRGGDDS